MAPKFGTSGLRGLVTELTQDLVSDYTRSFLAACPTGGAVFVGRDLRPSSPQIAEWVMRAVEGEGVQVFDCGVLPTPALALASLSAGQAAIMVTGSHIPADRNGLKFYVPIGEISKADEAAINAHLGRHQSATDAPRRQRHDALDAFAERYVRAFGPASLDGLRIGVYQHSSVARDLLVRVLSDLGADVEPLARSDTFVPVDTEALDPETRTMLQGWCRSHRLDAVVSTDGDADRPMVADAQGHVVPGDVLGALTALGLGARMICTPVSSNTMIARMSAFETIRTTRIGSPYVIAAMEEILAEDRAALVVGYEANGGFLLGFEADGPNGSLAPLMTRDCLLPILAPLVQAKERGLPLAQLVASLPSRYTAADRIAGIETATSKAFIQTLSGDPCARAEFFGDTGRETNLDETDGLRVTFDTGDVVHLRPSGNAPEFRCYAEADNPVRASALVTAHLTKLRDRLA